MIDEGSTSTTAKHTDKKIQIDEWNKHIQTIKSIGKVWANFKCFEDPKPEDFKQIDIHGRGEVTYQEFCLWVSKNEIFNETEIGEDLKLSI